MAKKSIKLTNEDLTKANAGGDDTNLAENGSNPYYLYSIGDGFRLALWLRKSLLGYTNIPVQGEEYAASRENDNNILVTDPYYAGSFKDYLNDDIFRITATGHFRTHVEPWGHMPKVIIIPLLAGFHWGIIKIDIDYGNKEVAILFDDPYGEIGLIHSFKNTFMPIIIGNIECLIRQEAREDNFILTKDKIKCDSKPIDQQGRGENSWDCGAIAFSNIEDYIRSIPEKSGVQYTIPACNETAHKSQIASARVSHIDRYKEVAGVSVASAEERLRKAEKLLEGENQERKVALKKLPGNYDYSKLSDAEISMLFTVLENKRLFEGENITEAYTESELSYAYEFVSGYSNNYRSKGQNSGGYAVSARANTTPISIPEDEQALDKGISELERKLFPKLHSSTPLTLPNTEQEKAKALSYIKEAYEKGVQHYHEGNLVLAEQEFVKVLRPVLSKPSMKNLYVNTEEVKDKVLGAMHHLGLIYQASDQYFDHHSKATAIFQYCASFAEKREIALKLKENIVGDADYFIKQAHLTEQEFLKSIGKGGSAENDSSHASQQQTAGYKQQLSEIRSQVKVKLEEVNSFTVERIDARTKAIEEIYGYSSSFFVSHEAEGSEDNAPTPGLVQKLLADCHRQLGGVLPGCEYAVIGLGSLAGGRMTPWSDLEFAILVNEDKEEYKEYFRNLTKLLHIKMINLGETPLRSVGIEALNNFKTAEAGDEWFWDDLTTSGFSFDGPDWHACKLPLGRQGNYKATKKVKKEQGIEEMVTEEKRDYELILTPKQMAAFQKEEHGWFKSDVYLVQGLRLVSLIDGSQALLDNYRQEVRAAENPEIIKKRALEKLTKDLGDFSLKVGDEAEGKLIDVKKDIFRIGDRIIDDLANYYGIMAEKGYSQLTAWEMIDTMLKMDILSKEGAGHLKEALSIAAGLRLDTYSHNKGQKETVSTYQPAVGHLSEEQKHKLLHETFYIKDTSILHHFYYVMLSVQELARMFCSKKASALDYAQVVLKCDKLFNDGNFLKGMVHARFLEYTDAINCLEAALEERQDLREDILKNLFYLYCKTGKLTQAVAVSKELLSKTIEKDGDSAPSTAACYEMLGAACFKKGDYPSAIEHYKKALEIQRQVCLDLNPLDIAETNYSLGAAHLGNGDYLSALKFYYHSLDTKLKVYAYDPYHPSIAQTFHDIGIIYYRQGNYNQARVCCNIELEIQKVAYHSTPNHPDIAKTYNSLGDQSRVAGQYDQGEKFYSYALSIRLTIYPQAHTHPEIASSYNSLGEISRLKGEYGKAIDFHSKAREIYQQLYSLDPNHLDIAHNYNNLGMVYFDKKDYGEAIVCYLKALAVKREAYKSNPNNTDIASAYNNLGNAYLEKGKYQEALECHNQTLQILHQIYPGLSNLQVAYAYHNLGNVHFRQKNYNEAQDHYNKALDIKLKVFEGNANHPGIALTYQNLGAVFLEQGKYAKAVSYSSKAQSIYEGLYTNLLRHADAVGNLCNLQKALQKNSERIAEIIAYYNEEKYFPFLLKYLQQGISLTYDQVNEVREAYKLYQDIYPSYERPLDEFFVLYPFENNPDFFMS